MSKCHARRQNDQMHCNKCGLLWDINDPDPPKCNQEILIDGKLIKAAEFKPYKGVDKK